MIDELRKQSWFSQKKKEKKTVMNNFFFLEENSIPYFLDTSN
jgi:hypothetical protein